MINLGKDSNGILGPHNPQKYARCHSRSQGTAGQSSDEEFTQPTKGNSSKQTLVQYSD